MECLAIELHPSSATRSGNTISPTSSLVALVYFVQLKAVWAENEGINLNGEQADQCLPGEEEDEPLWPLLTFAVAFILIFVFVFHKLGRCVEKKKDRRPTMGQHLTQQANIASRAAQALQAGLQSTFVKALQDNDGREILCYKQKNPKFNDMLHRRVRDKRTVTVETVFSTKENKGGIGVEEGADRRADHASGAPEARAARRRRSRCMRRPEGYGVNSAPQLRGPSCPQIRPFVYWATRLQFPMQ